MRQADGVRKAAWAAIYAGFAATGVGCALPGVLLPRLLAEQHWQDAQGGRLFLLIALGSAMGPLLVTMRAHRAAATGSLLVALAGAGWSVAGSPMLALCVFWGLGLGMTMTGISLVSQRLVRNGGRAAVLTRLNFLWAAGACACPLLASRMMVRGSTAGPLRAMALLFGVLSVGMGLLVPAVLRGRESDGAAAGSAWRASYWDPRGIPLGLLAATALATGIEASGGAWLATYAGRAGGHVLLTTIAAPSCFWAGLLASRALSWTSRPWLHGRPFLRAMLLTVLLAAGSLLLPFRRGTLLGSSFALGFGLGPLYPELLARVLRFRPSSLVFFLAGLCSAFLPWATGLLSSAAGSLRWGLLVPGAGALVMLLSGWSAPKDEPR